MIEDMKRIVKAAGQIVLNANQIQNGVESKQGRANFVTKYDVEVQNYLFRELKKLYPTASFVGEEDESNRDTTGEFCFIIDPIDGTTNFIFDYHHSSISVAFLHHGKVAAGIVYNPYLDEMFYAELGTGAFLNGHPLKVTDLSLSDGIAGIGTSPYNIEKADETFRISRKVFDRVLDIRRTGSAALDICYVAANRFVLYFELILSPWDYAAASLILREAGGCVTTVDGKELTFSDKISVVAATPKAFKEFLTL